MDKIALIAIILQYVVIIIILFKLKSGRDGGSEGKVSDIEKLIEKNNEQIYRQMDSAMKYQNGNLEQLNRSFHSFSTEYNQRQELMRDGIYEQIGKFKLDVNRRIESLERANSGQLDSMRAVVDEKMQKTLQESISRSFRTVDSKLEEVNKGLGEMRNLAGSVGDLERILSNVKTRGTMGEAQLDSILSDMLAPNQYEKQFRLDGSRDSFVDFAVKFPGENGENIYLPVDSKFPMDRYISYLNATESGDSKKVEVCGREFARALYTQAKSINSKYIMPPRTTDFAIMFLPSEGLYAETVRLGIVDEIQRRYRVTVAGPVTVAAILSSFQMGFRILAIQQNTGEVWETLEAVKAEFEEFSEVLRKTRNNMSSAVKKLDELVITRTNVMRKKLDKVDIMQDLDRADDILGLERIEPEEED